MCAKSYLQIVIYHPSIEFANRDLDEFIGYDEQERRKFKRFANAGLVYRIRQWRAKLRSCEPGHSRPLASGYTESRCVVHKNEKKYLLMLRHIGSAHSSGLWI
jgi:hypothetical protein